MGDTGTSVDQGGASGSSNIELGGKQPAAGGGRERGRCCWNEPPGGSGLRRWRA